MKKILSFIMIVCAVVISGCSCSKEGEYEFEYFVLNDKKYTCTDAQERDPITGPVCAVYDDMEIFLSKDGKMTKTVDDIVTEEAWYKIKDGKFLVSLADKKTDDTYVERGKYKMGRLSIILDEVKVVFEK